MMGFRMWVVTAFIRRSSNIWHQAKVNQWFGSDIFLQNNGRLPTDYTALYSKGLNYLNCKSKTLAS
jgi:hypothetical protein